MDHPLLELSADELLAEHTGNTDVVDAHARVRAAQLDKVRDLVWDMTPRHFTCEQRGRCESFAEEAAIAGRDVEAAILYTVAMIETGAIKC